MGKPSGTIAGLKFKYSGFNAIRKSPGVTAEVERRARAVLAEAGEGMDLQVRNNKSRVQATIITASRAAREAEATDKTLTRALNAGR